MNDMSATIIPKSDQLNADDLIAGPKTIKITGVTIRAGQEQPISISFEGDNGKPYKACKSMCRVMVTAWGPDSKKYTGRSMTLYRDAAVKWGGLAVGGIRISHMSDINSALTMALTETRASKKPFTVRPLVAPKESAAAQMPERATAGVDATQASPRSSAPLADPAYITPDQVATIETRCLDNSIPLADLKEAASVAELSLILAKKYRAVMAWIDSEIDSRQAA